MEEYLGQNTSEDVSGNAVVNVTESIESNSNYEAANNATLNNAEQNAVYQNTNEPVFTEEDIKKQKKSYFASFAWKLLLSILFIFFIQIIIRIPEFIVTAAFKYIANNRTGDLAEFFSTLFENGFMDSASAVLSYLYLIVSDGLGALLLFILTRKKSKVPEQKNMKFGWWFVCFMCCFGIGGVGSILGVIVNAIVMLPSTVITTMFAFAPPLTGNNIVENLIYQDDSWAYLFIGIITVGIVVPFLEELIFRKLIIDNTSKYGFGAAIMLSGLSFGLFHGNLVQFFYATALGILFAFIYASTGKLRYTVLLHMGYNLYSSAIMPLARKTVPSEALDGIKNALDLMSNNLQNGMELSKAFSVYSDMVGKILDSYPFIFLGIIVMAMVNLLYFVLITIGILFIIIFMKRALNHKKTMIMGQKGTKRCAAFNWASILLWVCLGFVFVIYYGALFLGSLVSIFV